MPRASCLRIVGDRGHVISDAVPLSGLEFRVVAQGLQLRVGDMLNALEIVGELAPKLIDCRDNGLGGGQERVVGLVLVSMPLPLVDSIYKNGLRPSRPALQNTTGDRAIANSQHIGIAEQVSIKAAIDIYHRKNARFRVLFPILERLTF